MERTKISTFRDLCSGESFAEIQSGSYLGRTQVRMEDSEVLEEPSEKDPNDSSIQFLDAPPQRFRPKVKLAGIQKKLPESSDGEEVEMEQDILRNQSKRLVFRRMQTMKVQLPVKLEDELKVYAENISDNPLAQLVLRREREKCYGCKYLLTAFQYYIVRAARAVVVHPLFDLIILCFILANCVIIAADDPSNDDQASWLIYSEYGFQALYTTEIIIKIVAMGLIVSEDAYLRDPWNVLDFGIVFFGYLGYFDLGGNWNLKILRAFRILRPLRTISFIEGLRILITALFSSLPLLIDTLLILLFLYFLFTIAGVQLWHGKLFFRCMEIETGTILEEEVCGDEECGSGYICVKYITNINFGVTNFDNVFSGMLTVFQCVTLQGWSSILVAIVNSSGVYGIFYFVALTIVGSFFILNFTLAVITSRVTQLFRGLQQVHKEKPVVIVPPPDPVKKQKEDAKNIFGLAAIKMLVNKLGFKEMQDVQDKEGNKKTDRIETALETTSGDLTKLDSATPCIFPPLAKRPVYFIDNPSQQKRLPKKILLIFTTFQDFEISLIRAIRKGRTVIENNSPDKKNAFSISTFSTAMKIFAPKGENTPEKKEEKKNNIEDDEDSPEETPKQKRMRMKMRSIFAQDSVKDENEEKKEETTEKVFILKDGPIEISSAMEVIPHSLQAKTRVQALSKALPPPPYKMRILYEYEDLSILNLDVEEWKEQQMKKTVSESNSSQNTPISTPNSSARILPEPQKTLTFSIGSSTHRKKNPKMISRQGSKRQLRIFKAKEEEVKLKKEAETSRARQLGILNSSHSQDTPQSSTIKKQGLVGSSWAKKKKEKAEQSLVDADHSVPQTLAEIQYGDKIEHKIVTKWSGQDILGNCDPDKAIWLTTVFNSIYLWEKGWKGTYHSIKHIVAKFVKSGFFENVMICIVVFNTTILAINRAHQPDSEKQVQAICNYLFSSIYIGELLLKIFGLGIVKYFMDALNYLDCFVVLLSLVEMIFLDSSGDLSAFLALKVLRVVRVVRTFRVIRMARLFKILRSMQLIIEVIGKTLEPFAYIILLMLMFLFIYSLIAMQLFSGRFNFPEGVPRQNFDSFNSAFLTMFEVMTMESWHSVLYNAMRAQISFIVAPFLMSWIFIGNYVLMNLFLAIMLEAFIHTDEAISHSEQQTKEEVLTKAIKAKANQKTGSSCKAQQLLDKMRKKKKVLSEDEINQILKAKKEKKNVPLKDSHANYSFYIFSKENPFRIYCWHISTSAWFEFIVTILIVLSSLQLAIDTYYSDSDNEVATTILNITNTFITIAFAIETLIKSITNGFIFDHNSYLRDTWNQLDFIIVSLSLIDMAVPAIDVQIIKIFRLLRTIRPLRFVTHNTHMRILVKALFKSLSSICNAFFVVLLFYIMFSILGVSFFASKFDYCSKDEYENNTAEECAEAGGVWQVYNHNFENVVNGLIFLFVLNTLENWPSTILQAIDCTEENHGPVKGQSWYYAYFFVIFICISSMFLLNLFVGVLFLHFSKERQFEVSKKGIVTLSEEQLNWIEVQKMILRAKPNYNARTIPADSSWRRPIHAFTTSIIFEVCMTIVILLNMVHMALIYEGASNEYTYALNILNYIFTGCFTCEVILKMISYGLDFWYDSWNILGLLIVSSSHIDIIFTNIYTTSLVFLRIVPSLVRVLRVLRISRLLRLMRKYKRMQELMEIVLLCLPSMLNVFALMFLILFIYSVLGCFLFSDITSGSVINNFYNFSNFGKGMIMCIKLATGENWDNFMFDYARPDPSCAAGLACGNWTAFLFFISFKLALTFIMLNFYILAVLGLFDMYFVESDSLVSKYKEDFEIFQENWHKIGPTHRGFMLSQAKLVKFFSILPEPIGMEGKELNLIAKEVMDMNVNVDLNKNVFFNELLLCMTKRSRAKNIRMNKLLIKNEKITRNKIQELAEGLSIGVSYKTERKSFVMNQSNPFVALMLMRLTFKLWRNCNTRHQRHIIEYRKRGKRYVSSDEEMSDPGTPMTRNNCVPVMNPVAKRDRVYPVSRTKKNKDNLRIKSLKKANQKHLREMGIYPK